MKNLITVLAVSLAALSTSAFATSHKEAPNMAKGASSPMAADQAAPMASAPMRKQQTKMGTCSSDFKTTGKPGAERQAFMKECLKKDSDVKPAQQTKMKTCSADFTTTKKPGSERQAFMKECLSK